MVDGSVNKSLVEQLYKQAVLILQYVAEHHARILSCEIEWVRHEESGAVILTDMKNIILAKANNRPFTNSLYRHMKRNMVAILDEEKKEQELMKKQEQEEFLMATYGPKA